VAVGRDWEAGGHGVAIEARMRMTVGARVLGDEAKLG